MNTIAYPAFRALFAALFVAGLGFAGSGQCGAIRTHGRSHRAACGSTQNCACCQTTERCPCPSTCLCGRKLPGKGDGLPVLSTTAERDQLLNQVAEFMPRGHAAVSVFHPKYDDNCLLENSLSLLALGTRLNC